MAKDNATTDDKIELDAMPGADPKTEEDTKGFEVDMNFDTPEEDEVEFPKEEEIEEVEELKAEEESPEVPEEETEEEVVEAADEVAEDTGEETVLAENDGDTQQPVEPVQERAEQKEPMIPKSRFDEVLAKQKALQKQLDDAANPVSKIEKAPEYDFDAKEVEYQEHILNGKAEEAVKLRKEIRAAERQQMMFEVQNQMGQTVQQSTEAVALQNKALELQAAYPQLDENSGTYDEVLTNEMMDLRDAFMIQGFNGADALDKAAKYLLPQQQAEVVAKPDPVQKQVTQKKQVANVNKKLQAAESQPPTMKTGKQKVEKKVDVSLLSADEFEALPDETLRRMRGDFG